MDTDSLLREVIAKARRNNESDAECLGIAIAQFFKWDARFIDVAAFAAEEANFAAFGRICDDYQSKLNDQLDAQEAAMEGNAR